MQKYKQQFTRALDNGEEKEFNAIGIRSYQSLWKVVNSRNCNRKQYTKICEEFQKEDMHGKLEQIRTMRMKSQELGRQIAQLEEESRARNAIDLENEPQPADSSDVSL